MTRPRVLVGVAGTATGVGKTWGTARLMERLAATGVRLSARKPAQSYDAEDKEPTDAEVLGGACGEAAATVCPPHRSYPVAMAPPMAASVLGLPSPTLAELLEELRWPSEKVDVGFVETVGGVRSPVADDGDSRDLIRHLGCDLVLLVADAGLGAIDAVRLAVDALHPVKPLVLLNRFRPSDTLHRRNLDWLVQRDGIRAVADLDEACAAISRLL